MMITEITILLSIYRTRLDKMSSAENATESITNRDEETVEISESNVDYVELALDNVKVGLQFSSYEEALNSVLEWCEVNYFPLIKRSTRPGNWKIICKTKMYSN